jgi:hypothetical protein
MALALGTAGKPWALACAREEGAKLAATTPGGTPDAAPLRSGSPSCSWAARDAACAHARRVTSDMGDARVMIEQGAAVYSAIHARLHQSQARLIKVLCRLNRWHFKEMRKGDMVADLV